ncbi:MAG: hypothetical protein P4L51_14480 [Puia sp.]|nr:hypothetical protein [Puia sp.]
MGFSALVRKNTHETLAQLYRDLFATQVDHIDVNLKALAQARAARLGEQYTDSSLRMVNISDSILIWTAHGQPSALFEITYAVSTLLGVSLIQGLPLRGSITRQPFSVLEDKTALSVVGMGLVHAYGLEKKQRWSGCIIDPEIINYFRSIEKVFFQRDAASPIERQEMVYEYDVPIVGRDGRSVTEKGYAVDWSNLNITDAMIRESFDAHRKKDDRAGSSTPDKIQNTLDFHHFCLEKAAEKKAAYEALSRALKKE